MSLVEPGAGVAGSRSGKFGAVRVAAAVGGEVLEVGRSVVGMGAAAGVVAARRVLGLRSGALRAAVVAAVGRRSKRMLGLLEAVRLSLGWSFGRYAMGRIGTMAVSSDAMIGGAEEAFESRAGVAALRVAVAAGTAVVGVEAGIAE